MTDTFQRLGTWLDNSWLAKLFPNTPRSRYWNWMLGSSAPVWIDTQDLWRLYATIPHLNVVINKRAELLSLGKIGLRKIDTGEEIIEHDVLKLLRKPNPLQARAEWVTQYLTFKDVYANIPIYKLFGVEGMKRIPDAMWNLPPSMVKIIPTGKIFNQTKIEDIIKEYRLCYAGNETIFTPSQILFKNDNVGSEYLKSDSKIIALAKPLSNIEGALQTQNVLIQEHGAYGMISSSSKDETGAVPLGKAERERIEKMEQRDYGNRNGQRRKIITNASLTYTPMSFPIKDMLLTESNEEHFRMILSSYGVDDRVFPSSKDATWENKKQGLIMTIQNSIQPEGDDLCQTLNEDFGLTEEGIELYMTFNHLPIMQEDKQLKENARKTRAETNTILYDKRLLSIEAFARDMGIDIKDVPKLLPTSNESVDNLGKIPLALQQLALAATRAEADGNGKLAAKLHKKIDELLSQI